MNQVQNLQHIARELLYLGMDGSPIYTDHFRQLNTEVFRLSEALFSMKGALYFCFYTVDCFIKRLQ